MVSLSSRISYYTVLTFFLWWYEMIKCLHDEMKGVNDAGTVGQGEASTDLLLIFQKEGHLVPNCSWPRISEMWESRAIMSRDFRIMSYLLSAILLLVYCSLVHSSPFHHQSMFLIGTSLNTLTSIKATLEE